MVVVVIQIEYQFLLEVFHRIEILKIEQFALEQTKEVFDYGIIQTVALSAHALNDTVIRQLSLILFVLVLPALIRMQDGSCSEVRWRAAASSMFMIIESTGQSEIT